MDLTGRTVRKGWGALERERHYLCRTPTGGIQPVEVHGHDRVLVQRRLRSLGVDRVLRRSRENVAVSTGQPLLPPAASPSNMKPDNAQSGHHSPTTCLSLRPLDTGSSSSSVLQRSSKSFIGNSSRASLSPGNRPSVPGASYQKCEILVGRGSSGPAFDGDQSVVVHRRSPGRSPSLRMGRALAGGAAAGGLGPACRRATRGRIRGASKLSAIAPAVRPWPVGRNVRRGSRPLRTPALSAAGVGRGMKWLYRAPPTPPSSRGEGAGCQVICGE